MVKKLDFNALEKPVLEITLRDKEQTVLRITSPTEELVERFTAAAEELKSITGENNGERISALFGLIAELMNCNLDEITLTAEDLRGKYGLKLYDAVVFCKVYLDFIQELENAKN